METISIAKCGSYGNAEEAVRRAVKLSGGVPRKKSALVKVNLLSASRPEEGVTTNPAIVKAAILELKKKCGKVCVGDQPGFTSLERAAKKSGILETCEETGAELIEFEETKKYENPHAIIAKNPELFTSAFDFELVVNVPKLKTHSLTVYTGAVKNLFGFVPNAQRKFYHLKHPDAVSFSRMLLDNYLLIKPQLNIMDGVVGMEGEGPSAGRLRNFGFVAAGRDALALDAACAHILGIEKNVPLLNIARKTGLESAFVENVKLAGDRIEQIENLALPKGSIFRMPAPFLKLARELLSARPYALKKKCTGCGTCASVCPAEAIKIEKFPVFDYQKCVRCYTCQEMCPEKAIQLYENRIVGAVKTCYGRMGAY